MELTQNKMKVNVLQELQIAPPSGSVPPMSLPLTFFDQMFLATPPSQLLMFYQFHHPKTYFTNTILPDIKHSFSLALQHFYPLAGNLSWHQNSTNPELVYKDGDAVSLTVAKSDYEFCQLASNYERDPTIFYPLSPVLKSISSSEELVPLLALQVTLFRNKGICVGISLNPAVADGRAFYHFLKSWALLCRLKGDASLMNISLPSHDRSVLSHLKGNHVISLKADHHVIPNHTNVQATFVMRRYPIKRLKQWVSICLEKENNRALSKNLSSFMVTCAYVWVCLLKARWGVTDKSKETEHLVVPVDVRARLDPPLPLTYFGNCMARVCVMAKRDDIIGECGIVKAAKLIASGMQNICIHGETEKDFTSVPPDAVTCSPIFGLYEVDFGCGKPMKVEMSSMHRARRGISLIECPEEEGAIEIGLVCDAVEMDDFASYFVNSLGPLSLM